MRVFFVRLKGALIVLFGLALALIPVWIVLVLNAMLDPEGFWQKLVLFGGGIWILGIVQLVLVVLWMIFAFWFWCEWVERDVTLIRREARKRENEEGSDFW